MRLRNTSNVRIKIVALLAALAMLWGFAAWVTVRDGMNLLFVNNLDNNVGRPTEAMLETLQQERRLSTEALSGGSTEQVALAEAREDTDDVVRQWHDGVSSASLRFTASEDLQQRLDTAAQALAGLPQLRQEVDAGQADVIAVTADFTEIIDSGFHIYGAITSLDDQELARQADNLITMTRARDVISQQDALIAGALAQERLTSAEIAEFHHMVGAQRFLYELGAAELVPEDRAIFDQVAAGPEMEELRGTEDLIIAHAGGAPPASASEWQVSTQAAMSVLRDFELAAADNTLDRASPAVAGVIVRLLLAGGLGLVALIAAIIISVTTARNLVRQLERLRDAARDLAENRLPQVVARLSVGEQVDVTAQAPPLRFGNDEIGQVGQAFNSVQETAVRAAVQQAELRRGVRDVFLSLARRTQSLVHKQLGVLDTVERRVTDADEMEDLFRIDHLATRMRRNAENLIVLSGASAGRVWRQPIAMIDVVRGALAEVEDYTRVNVLPVETAALEGRVVGDVIHLLAELIENAAAFSPPYAPVSVSGQRVAHGFVVEVEDRGLGMSDEELATVNRQLVDPPDFSLADASRLGHYVVAKLAQRHGVKVHLRRSPYGGVAAIVLLPSELLVEGEVAASTVTTVAASATTTATSATTTATSATAAAASAATVAASATPVRAESSGAQPDRPAPAGHAPSGLPLRVRQASLPHQLKVEEDLNEPEQSDRDPEVVRQMMSAYQRGTQLGRSDAAADSVELTPHSNDSQEG